MNWQFCTARNLITLGLLTFFLNACTDANPQVSQLKNLESFELMSPQIATSDLTAVSVVAKCSAYITSVDVSFDAGATWSPANTYDAASTTNCSSTKEFKITLSQSKAPWSGMGITSGMHLPVQFRAHSRMGTQILRNLQVLFTAGATSSQEVLVGAQRVQTGSGLQLRSRLRFQKQDVATGGGYILRGRIAQ